MLAKTRRIGEIGKTEILGEIGFHKIDDALTLRARQRRPRIDAIPARPVADVVIAQDLKRERL